MIENRPIFLLFFVEFYILFIDRIFRLLPEIISRRVTIRVVIDGETWKTKELHRGSCDIFAMGRPDVGVSRDGGPNISVNDRNKIYGHRPLLVPKTYWIITRINPEF